MSELSKEQHEMARDFESLIFQHLSSAGQRYVAAALITSESKISRMKSDKIENSNDTEILRFCKMLSYIGLQIVPKDMQCFSEGDVSFFMYGTKKYLEGLNSPKDLKNKDDY